MTEDGKPSYWPKQESAAEALRQSFEGETLFGRRGLTAERKAAVLARNILHEELGYFSDQQQAYGLGEDARDRLIVHARQDGAHALLLTIEVHRALRRIQWLLAFVAAAVAYLVVRTFI